MNISQRLRSLPRNVWATTLASLLTDISTDMVAFLLPLFLANVLGARTSAIGLIEGIAESTASLLKVFSGWLSDRLGGRKWLTIAGYSLSTVSKPFLAIVSSWPGVLAVRFFERAGKGIRTAPRDALIADSIAPEQRGLAFGFHRAGDTLGSFLGLALALLIVSQMQPNLDTLAPETFRTLVIISVIPAALGVLVLIVGVREIKPQTQSAPPRLSLRGLPPRFRAFLGILALFTLGNSSDAFLILRAQERGITVTGTLLMILSFNFVYTLASGPLGALSDRLGRRRVILAGWTIYGLIYLGFALASAGWQVWALYTLYGLYYAAFEGTAKALVADFVPQAQRGTAYGVYNALIGLMALPASVLAGLLWQGIGGWTGFGASAPFVVGAALALAAALLLSRLGDTT